MIDCFDYQPSLRPNPYHWLAQMRRNLRPIIQSAGRVQRWYATDLLSGDTFTGGVNPANPALNPYETRDFYLNVPPGSYIWAVGVWGQSSAQKGSDTNPVVSGNAGLEVEILDTCTRESWWRTSQSQCELGEATIADPNAAVVTGAITETDLVGHGLGLWLPAKPHLTADPGVQMVRLTANGRVGAFAGGFLTVGPIAAQVVLYASVPEEVA